MEPNQDSTQKVSSGEIRAGMHKAEFTREGMSKATKFGKVPQVCHQHPPAPRQGLRAAPGTLPSSPASPRSSS